MILILSSLIGPSAKQFSTENSQKSIIKIRETKHLSTNADSSTNCTVRWTKNTPKPKFVEKRKNHQKHKNSKMSRNMPKLVICPSTRGLQSIRKRGFQVDQEYPKPVFFEKWKISPKTQENSKHLEKCQNYRCTL